MTAPSKVLITGVSGFTGLHMQRRCECDGWDVFGLTNQPVLSNERVLCADLAETDRIAEWLDGVRPDYVVHLAGMSHVVGEALPFYQVNVLGTESLLTAIKRAGLMPKKILIASSANIYGQTPKSPIGEDEPAMPVNHYGISKVAMELLVRQWFTQLPIAISRPFNYTGPGQSEAFVFAKLAGAFRRREPSIRLGNVKVARDLSDVKFVVEAYYRLLLSPFAGDVVNICSGRPIAVRDALDILGELTGHDPRIEVDPELVRGNDIELMVGDPTRLHSIIGPLEPTSPLALFEEMLADGEPA